MSAVGPLRLSRFGVAAVVLSVALAAGCRPSPEHARPGTESGQADGQRHGEPAEAEAGADPVPAEPGRDGAEANEVAGEGDGEHEAVALGDGPPQVRLDAQTCESHDECRVFQPGDWNPRVECCYEYACDLDYVAVNTETWAAIRAWQRANPFDCAAHLQEVGPCNPRSPRCGLVQDAPAAACVEGLCQVAAPEVWPVIDPATQRCTSPADCLAFRPSSTSPEARCCGTACDGEWVAVNRDTATELDRWRNHHAVSCDTWRVDNACPPAGECNLIPPPVTCRGGECVVE